MGRSSKYLPSNDSKSASGKCENDKQSEKRIGLLCIQLWKDILFNDETGHKKDEADAESGKSGVLTQNLKELRIHGYSLPTKSVWPFVGIISMIPGCRVPGSSRHDFSLGHHTPPR